MDMNLNDSIERKPIIKKEVNEILENWRGIYSKEHTSIVQEIKKCTRRKHFVSSDSYGVGCLCRVEGNEAFRSVYNAYRKPFGKDEFVKIQKAVFQNRIENDCKKLNWYLSGIVTCENVYTLVRDIQAQLGEVETLIEEALKLAWEDHKMAFEVAPFYEMKKHVEVKEFDPEPPIGNLWRFVNKAIGVKIYEYDVTRAVQVLETAVQEMTAEADRIAIKAVDAMLTRKIVEPIKFVLNVM